MLRQSTTPTKPAAPTRGSFRPELQGLRALAVGLVLIYHLWPDHLSGGFVGVDVFFVVSGFLITGHLYRELSNTGTIRLGKFWARRVMRLLPLAFTVLLVSVITMLLLLPQTIWEMNVRQMLGALFYVENWVLAADSVDYMAADSEPSMVQHYWSLSIEEQFYVVLPIVLLGAYLLTKWLGRNRPARSFDTKKVFIWTLATITVAAFIFSVYYTNYSQAQAYFVTPTRFWEFSAGGLLAMLPAATRVPHRAQNMLGWTGIVGIVVAALMFSNETAFPGYTALLPVLGALLFIRYGSHQETAGVYWWASRKPMLRMGDWSYAIYLWHWPLIIIAGYQFEPLTWPYKIAIIILTFVLAMVSQRWIEDPLRHAPPLKVPARAFTFMGASMAAVAALTFVVPQALLPDTDQEVAISDCTGANALLNDCDETGVEDDPAIPSTQVQLEDTEPTYAECVIPRGETDKDVSDCTLGADAESAEYTVAVIGDSHARAWLPMLDELGKEKNWHIQGYTKNSCSPVPLASASPDSDQVEQEDSEACEQFVQDSSKEIEENENIDAVITAGSPTDHGFYDDSGTTSEQLAADAVNDMWQEWEAAGKEVIAIGEVPHFEELNGPTCVENNLDDAAEACSMPVDKANEGRESVLTSATESQDSPAAFYDPTPGICDDERCYSMVGNLVTRYDENHLSADFSRSYKADFLSFLEDQQILGNLNRSST